MIKEPDIDREMLGKLTEKYASERMTIHDPISDGISPRTMEVWLQFSKMIMIKEAYRDGYIHSSKAHIKQIEDLQKLVRECQDELKAKDVKIEELEIEMYRASILR